MNKNLLAIAITAALTLPSIAAAEVKIIGQAQLELVNTAGDAVTEGLTLGDSMKVGTPNANNASAIGITGSHDLGNGMTGLYKINFNFKADEAANGGLGGRDKFIGLKGDSGTVLVGRINTPYKTSTVSWDPFLATFMQARGQNGMSLLHNGYADNVIAYANNFGSTKFVGAVSLDEKNSDTPIDGERDAEHAVTASMNMPIGDSMELALAFLSGQVSHLAMGDTADAANGTAVKVGLKYKSGDLTVAGQFETLDEDLGDKDLVYVTASMAMGGGASISAGFGSRTDNTAAENDGTYTSIGYKKALSKKVSWHAGVVVIDEGVATATNDVTQFGAGMRVKF